MEKEVELENKIKSLNEDLIKSQNELKRRKDELEFIRSKKIKEEYSDINEAFKRLEKRIKYLNREPKNLPDIYYRAFLTGINPDKNEPRHSLVNNWDWTYQSYKTVYYKDCAERFVSIKKEDFELDENDRLIFEKYGIGYYYFTINKKWNPEVKWDESIMFSRKMDKLWELIYHIKSSELTQMNYGLLFYAQKCTFVDKDIDEYANYCKSHMILFDDINRNLKLMQNVIKKNKINQPF